MLHETIPSSAAADLVVRPGALAAPGRIAGLILLGGSVRASEFYEAAGRSPLQLPRSASRSLLDQWSENAALLSARFNYKIPVRVLADESSAKALQQNADPDSSITMEADPAEWRGTGGVLRDICGAYDPQDLLVVANCAQVLLQPLDALVHQLLALDADIAVLSHTDGTPCTFMIVRCRCLAGLADVGFIDMKEQALPQLAKTHNVKVLSAPRPVTMGVRTAGAYLRALRAAEQAASSAPLEHWRSAFRIIESGATVDASSRFHDAVVLKGAKVGPNAVVVRSVVCAGATVAPGESVVDQIALKDGRRIPTEELP